MRTLIFIFALLLPLASRAELRVVTTLSVHGAIAREIVGSQGKVEVLAPPDQDPHFIDARPTMMLALNRADLLVEAGLGLEAGWLPTLVKGARNGKILDGKPGRFVAAAHSGKLLEIPTSLDRSLGDVHPGGNPHTFYDPRRMIPFATALGERLGQLDPKNARAYGERAAALNARLQEKTKAWEAAMAPFRGRAVVSYHKSFVYLEEWLGLRNVGTLEPLPGIPPSPSHLASLIVRMREMEARPVVIAEPFYNLRTARTVAEKAGSPFVSLRGQPRKDESYEAWMDSLLAELRKAWEGGK